MKRTIFNTTSVQLRPAAMDSVIDSICSAESLSRFEITEATSLGTSSVAKAVKALLETGAVVEKHTPRRGPSVKGAPESRICLSNKICTAVIDLSSSIYSVNLICNGKSYLRYAHKYNAGLDFRENLYELLSRAFLKIRLKDGVAMSVCVLYADNVSGDKNVQAYLPNELDKELVDATLYEVCRRVTTEYISKSQAIRDAVKFNVISRAGGLGGISFLSVGNTLSAFYVSGDQKPIACKIQNLFIDNNVTAGEYANRCFTKDQFEHLLLKAINLIDTAFGASTIVIESDTFEINATTIKFISRSFAAAKLSLPIIHTLCPSGDDVGVCVLSAAKRTESNFVKSLIQFEK